MEANFFEQTVLEAFKSFSPLKITFNYSYYASVVKWRKYIEKQKKWQRAEKKLHHQFT